MRERVLAEDAQKDIQHDGRQPAEAHGAQEGDDTLFEAEALWHDDAVGLLVHELVERDAEEFGEAQKDAHVRDAVALLPLGDGLIGIVELFRELGLRQIRHLPQAHDVLADDGRQVVLFFFHTLIIGKMRGKVNDSTVSRA